MAFVPHVVRVTRGVWRPAAAVSDLPGRCAALLSCAPPGSAVAGLAAAQLHGLWLPADLEASIDLVLRPGVAEPRDHAGTRRTELRGRRRQVCPDEITVVDGLPVTCLGRTWVDLAEDLSLPDLVAAGDCALRAGATERELILMVSRAAHRRGVVRARAALALLDGRSRSRPESHLRVALVGAGLPAPAVNAPIYSWTGEWLAEPDLSYDDAKLAIEYNGIEHATPDRMRRDITREVDVAMRGGWRSVVFGPVEVFRRPDQCALLVRRIRVERLRLLS